jgi:hypothetical protein
MISVHQLVGLDLRIQGYILYGFAVEKLRIF